MKILNFFKEKQELPKPTGFTYVEQAPDRAKKDLSNWKLAIQTAEMNGYQNRRDLLNIYIEQLDIDAHLMGVLRKRTAKVLGYELQFVRNGEVDERMTEWLQADTFRAFLKDLHETIYWGHSLFQFENVRQGDKNWFKYYLIPRKHVNAAKKQVVKNDYDSKGMSYAELLKSGYVAEAGGAYDLGLLKTLSFYSIAKRNVMGDYFTYSEEAGRNFKTVLYQGGDVKRANELIRALKNAGSGGGVAIPEGLTVDIKSGSTGSQNQLFENLIKWLNEEMSKLVLGQVMTTDSGSSRSQAEVHGEEQDIILNADKVFVLNWLNYVFYDSLKVWGIDPAGGRFAFKETMDLDSEIEKDLKLQQLGYVFTPEMIAEKYGL